MKNTGFRFGILIAVIAVTVVLLVPSFQFYSKSEEAQEQIRKDNPGKLRRILNLGLDLQGGMRLVLEIDRSKLDANDKDVIDRAYAIIENRINQLGVAEPVLQKQGRDRIIVELPGIKDERVAKDIIGRTAQLEFNLVRDDAARERAISIIESTVSGKADTSAEAKDAEATDEREKAEAQLADKLFGGSETAGAQAGETESDDPFRPASSFRSLIGYMGEAVVVRQEDVRKVDEILKRDDVRKALDRAGLGGNVFLWSNETVTPERGSSTSYKFLYYLKAAPEMRGSVIKNATAAIDQSGRNAGRAKVDIEMNSKGSRDFTRVTGANINKQLAIVLDETVYSAPRIISRISGGRAEITGSYTLEEAKALAIILRAGALPAPVNIVEERTVGPSLGQDAIQKGLLAGAIGTAFIVMFMLIYYRFSGLIALFALAINIAVVLAAMAAVNATLTLPGIAGLILLVGMGIDANVIIFERIKEEAALGKTVRSSIDSGYQNALSTILDSNITTLFVAFILLWKGTGPIRGFAITLIFGISASLFTALFVAKLIMTAIFQKKAKLSI
ncbi:MAG: protein translocase subunit SecD [Chitinispirillales bacterium]|jgi:protein-export membrane protein SecD|nr:protein translocase subunit SecD [Chitinispirillales bacterium]